MGNVPKPDAAIGDHSHLSSRALQLTESRAVAGPALDLDRQALADAERALVRRAQKGDVGAYEDLVRRHQSRVFAVASGVLRRNEDLEDVVQQVLLKVYLSLKRFDLRSAFSTWLYKVTVNECLDYLRKKKVRKLVYAADMNEEQAQHLQNIEETGGIPAMSASRRVELQQVLDGLLAELPQEEQLMLVLKEVEGLTVEEIGAVLDMNVNTVKVRMFRARGKLVEIYRRRMAARRAPVRSMRAGAGEERLK
jgi:RNA polymerase sigma-70 factor (ECF subfamily)